MKKHQFMIRKSEQGYVLIASLIFLLIITLLAISGISGNLIQTHLASNALDAQIALEAAEQTLVQAQIDILNGVDSDVSTLSTPSFDPDFARLSASAPPTTPAEQGFYMLDNTVAPVWASANFWDASNRANYFAAPAVAYANGSANGGFVVEYLGARKIMLGGGVSVYRITAYATGVSGNSPTVLQTVLSLPYSS